MKVAMCCAALLRARFECEVARLPSMTLCVRETVQKSRGESMCRCFELLETKSRGSASD
jgi:hypothetical protein